MTGTWIGVIIGAIIMAGGFGAMYRSLFRASRYRDDPQPQLLLGFVCFAAGFMLMAGSALGAFA